MVKFAVLTNTESKMKIKSELVKVKIFHYLTVSLFVNKESYYGNNDDENCSTDDEEDDEDYVPRWAEKRKQLQFVQLKHIKLFAL